MRRSEMLFGPNNRPTDNFATLLNVVDIPGDNLETINDALQKRFFQKNPDGSAKERWELSAIEVKCPVSHIREHLARCGFMNETHPMHAQYDYAAWPGALVTRAKDRLDDLDKSWRNGVRWKQTVVFGGQRELLADKESFERCLKVVGNIQGAGDEFSNYSWYAIKPKTELDMMKFLWQNAYITSEMATTPILFVDTPVKTFMGGTSVRPNTEDTVTEWLKGDPKPGSILLSSGAPYGMAMDEAFHMLLEPHGFTVETFGHTAPESLGIEVLMREVAGAVNRIYRARKA